MFSISLELKLFPRFFYFTPETLAYHTSFIIWEIKIDVIKFQTSSSIF